MAIWTMEQYTALCEAIASGASTVMYGNKSVTYRSLADMLKLKSEMEKDLGLVNAGNTRLYPKLYKDL